MQLRNPLLPPQHEIARRIRADQGFVSHVRNGHVKRITSRIIRLEDYVRQIIDPRTPVLSEVEVYLNSGGDPHLLVQQVRILGEAQRIRR